MSMMSLSVLLFAAVNFAHALPIECEIHVTESESRTTIIDSNHLRRCDFIREGTACDFFVEDFDHFFSYNFDRVILDDLRPGQQFLGAYLRGTVGKTWDSTSEEFMNCETK